MLQKHPWSEQEARDMIRRFEEKLCMYQKAVASPLIETMEESAFLHIWLDGYSVREAIEMVEAIQRDWPHLGC